MQMDEEALANVASHAPQAQAPQPAGQDAQAEGKPAGPAEQKMFDTAAKQALLMLTSEQGAKALMTLAQSSGAAQAIAEMTMRVLEGVMKAASGAGVKVHPDVVPAAAKTSALVLAGLMQEAGLSDDAQATAQDAVALMEQQQGGGDGAVG